MIKEQKQMNKQKQKILKNVLKQSCSSESISPNLGIISCRDVDALSVIFSVFFALSLKVINYYKFLFHFLSTGLIEIKRLDKKCSFKHENCHCHFCKFCRL